MRVAVIGSRNAQLVEQDFVNRNIPADCTEIVSGGAAGIDTLAENAAHKLDIAFRCIRPDYKAYGRLAPLQRNIEIVKYCDFILAFWDMQSHGTRFVINECLKQDKPFKIIRI